MDPHRLAAYGALVGIFAFVTISLTGAFKIVPLFGFGVLMVGFGRRTVRGRHADCSDGART